MKVPVDILTKWKELRSHGDGKKIADDNEDVNEMDVTRAFKGRGISDEAFNAIAKFYQAKEAKIKEFMPKEE